MITLFFKLCHKADFCSRYEAWKDPKTNVILHIWQTKHLLTDVVKLKLLLLVCQLFVQ